MIRFPLAKMSPLIAILTAVILPLPIWFFWGAARSGFDVMSWTGWFVVALWVWLYTRWRPTGFDLDGEGLTVAFPLGSKRTSWADIEGAAPTDRKALQARFGKLLRVGAGGLWGGFGWLWSGGGWVEFYISRMDGYVLIERRGKLPLLITPRDPEGFLRALQQRLR